MRLPKNKVHLIIRTITQDLYLEQGLAIFLSDLRKSGICREFLRLRHTDLRQFPVKTDSPDSESTLFIPFDKVDRIYSCWHRREGESELSLSRSRHPEFLVEFDAICRDNRILIAVLIGKECRRHYLDPPMRSESCLDVQNCSRISQIDS